MPRPVTDSASLKAALASPTPGVRITMQPGFYNGPFTATGTGMPGCPITLQGAENGESSIINGKEEETCITFKGCNEWVIARFTVQGCKYGIVVESSMNLDFDQIVVHDTAEVGVIFHKMSTKNIWRRSRIYNTGFKFNQNNRGNGMRVGTSWEVTQKTGQTDATNQNKIFRSKFGPGIKIAALEALEGSSNNEVKECTFDQIPWFIMMRGKGWKVENNKFVVQKDRDYADSITLASFNGFGSGNTFSKNTIDLTGADAADYAFQMTEEACKAGNSVGGNSVKGAKKGNSNC